MSKTILIGALAGGVSVIAAGGGATYYLKSKGPSADERRVAAELAEQERYAREDEIHYATVFSSVRRDGRAGNASMPVMVMFHLAGTQGLRAFCGRLPVVEESVLRALAENGIEAPVREAVNRSLGGGPVRAATVRPLTDMAAGGMAARDTEAKCRKVLKS